MTYRLEAIDQLGPESRAIVVAAGITTTGDLMTLAHDPHRRREIAARTGLPDDRLLGWARMADLMRITGVSARYAELLLGAGIGGAGELAGRHARETAIALREVNETRRLVPVAPSITAVEQWIRQARRLDGSRRAPEATERDERSPAAWIPPRVVSRPLGDRRLAPTES